MISPGLKNGLRRSKAAVEVAIESNQGLCLTRQEAIDEAVRRFRRRRPVLVELSLDPLHEKVRQQVVEWVRTEYQTIISEGTTTV
jgi:hypothetical protein